MPSNAPAYALIMLNRHNDTGQTKFNTTDIGMDESAWRDLETLGVIGKQDVAGNTTFNPIAARHFLKLD